MRFTELVAASNDLLGGVSSGEPLGPFPAEREEARVERTPGPAARRRSASIPSSWIDEARAG